MKLRPDKNQAYLHGKELLLLSGLILEIERDKVSAKLFVILLILWIQDEEDKVKPVKGGGLSGKARKDIHICGGFLTLT